MALIEVGITSLPLEDRIDFFQTMSTWLNSGGGTISVNEAVRNTCDAFSQDEYKSLMGRMKRIVEEYDSGQVLFHEALRSANLGFAMQELAVVAAAEQSNQLRLALPSLVEAMKMRQDSIKDLKKQMTMPVVGGFALILMTLGVLRFMLPMVLGPVLQRSPEALEKFPSLIQYFWAASQWLVANQWFPIMLFVVPVSILLLRNLSFMRPLVEKITMIGPFKRIVISFNAVITVYFLPALSRSGMTMPDVLRSIATTIGNSGISGQMRVAATEHESGVALSDAVARLPFRTAFRNAVFAGERTGAIADRVEDLKVPFTTEYNRVVKRVTSTIRMAVMGFLVPMFLISMYTSLVAPIFALMEFG